MDRNVAEITKAMSAVASTMTSYLIATASVHVTAAAVDYLQDRLDPGSDDIVVVGVTEPGDDERDAGDAANVARSRLAGAPPTVDLRDGDPVAGIEAAIEDHDPDVVLIGPNDGTAGASGVGTTATELLARVDRPVVVVPVPGH